MKSATPFSPREEHVYYEVTRHMTERRLSTARTKVSLYGFFLICAAAILIPVFAYVSSVAAASGFTGYLSLIGSDGADLAGSWGSLMLSLAESVPVLGIALALGILALLGYLIRKFAMGRHVLYRTIIN